MHRKRQIGWRVGLGESDTVVNYNHITEIFKL